MAVSRNDTVEVIEEAAHGYIANYLSKELDPAVETELTGVKVYEVRSFMNPHLAHSQRFTAKRIIQRSVQYDAREGRSRRWQTSTSTVTN